MAAKAKATTGKKSTSKNLKVPASMAKRVKGGMPKYIK
jgi:hypothetical protein